MNCSPGEPLISFRPEQHILVTGASSGIGAAIAQRLNALGATIIASGRDQEKLEAMRLSCHAPERTKIEARDLTQKMEELPAWVRELALKYGKLHGLVCSAGMAFPMPLRLLDFEKSRELFYLNYFAPILLAQGFCDRRNNSGKGASIVFIASIAATLPQRAQAIYAGSKAALVESAKCISLEHSTSGLRVNCISPAEVVTPLFYAFNEELGEKEPEKTIARRYPLGLGQPEDVSALAAFLLSDNARWITGQNYILDGGLMECSMTW